MTEREGKLLTASASYCKFYDHADKLTGFLLKCYDATLAAIVKPTTIINRDLENKNVRLKWKEEVNDEHLFFLSRTQFLI